MILSESLGEQIRRWRSLGIDMIRVWELKAIDLETALKDAMEQSKASQKVLLIEQQKHLDTSNWAAEQQDRADVAEAKVSKLEAVVEAAKLIHAEWWIDDDTVSPEIERLHHALADLEDGE